MSVDHTQNIIEVKNVSFSYNHEKVLENINLTVHQGDYLGIVGPNGGGKTTLLKLILGLLKPTSWTITTSAFPIGYVAQKATNFDVNFPITVREVVAQGRLAGHGLIYRFTNEDNAMIDKAIKTVDLFDYKDKLIGELSGGQQQRVFIARALAGPHPHVIFLDEPTAGVDAASQQKFYAFLKKLNRDLGMTLVLISHDVDIISNEVSHVAYVNQTLIYYADPKSFMKEHYLLHQQNHA